MKKKLTILLIAVVSIISIFSGCNKDGGGVLSKTPQEEYNRMYSFSSPGMTFNFSEIKSFESDRIISFVSDDILSNNNGKPVQEKLFFQFNVSSSPKSYCNSHMLDTFRDKKALYFDEAILAYEKGTYYSLVGPTSYNYEDFIQMEGFYEEKVRNSTRLYNPDNLENFTGGKNGSKYFLKTYVKEDKKDDFFKWYLENTPYHEYVMSGTGGGKFFDLSDGIISASIDLQTNVSQLLKVVYTIKLKSLDLGEITMTSSASYKIGNVTVKDYPKE